MESCSICCFPYSEQKNSDGSSKAEKKLNCNHSLCKSCYLRLDKTICPFCRSTFKYSIDDLKERKLLDINYNSWQPPSQINDYIPENLTENRRVRNRVRNRNPPQNITLPIHIIPTEEESALAPQEPFSRVRKNMVRNRRRNLDFDEVLERRRIIKKRCQKKWSRKNLRVEKEIQSSLEGCLLN
tara:strand:- start:309 stop:860 length:552 start_codon:yes stop_codon:yes gene_type:complete